MALDTKLTEFYKAHLPESRIEGTMLRAECPFCAKKGRKKTGAIIVFLGAEGYFTGYFRCLSRCVPGGFAAHFARLRGLESGSVPGHDPDGEPYLEKSEFPLDTINSDIPKYQSSITVKIKERFAGQGVSAETLEELKIGFNGRYIVYPYYMANGNCYTAHCISPENKSEQFWHGDQSFSANGLQIFNINDIDYCQGGALFVVEGEENLLCLRELGFPGVAVPVAKDLAFIDPKRFQYIQTVFLVVNNSLEADNAARAFAARVGFKVRMLSWPAQRERDFCLVKLAREDSADFKNQVTAMVKASQAFSPFRRPGREYQVFLENIDRQHSESFQALHTGIKGFDAAMDGIHGINIIGGAPKAGKSCLGIQLATEMARKKVPVVYYDFENGVQKIYQRTLSRLSRLPVERIIDDNGDAEETRRLDTAKEDFRNMLEYFRVVNDRQLTPEIMRRHIDFLCHETRKDDVVVVVDSLHKLPFKDFSERRTGIDAWLREFESIRDEMNVAFLVISELSRQEGGRYDGVPHMGLFKDSGDIEYTADNALVFLPEWNPVDITDQGERINALWLVASREYSPGLIARYRLDFPFWGFTELD
ncbi:MAG: AAA family ATPase [Proteobacteria bacterium]|nr:AAA family ATPase [Pseudomonadota bacterium]MBU1709417.1 AAA family ATPase [Pseudomonadota bacterium]